MTWMILAAAAIAQAPGATRERPDAGLFPLALHRSMELDDLDREIRRQHDVVLVKRSELATTRKLARRGAVSPMDLEREESDTRYQEAHEREMIAYRELKRYERDVLARKVKADDAEAFKLLLNLLKRQEDMARVDLDFRTYTLQRLIELKKRTAVNRDEEEAADFDYHSSAASVALNQARQAEVAMQLAIRTGEKDFDRDRLSELERGYLKARVRYAEIQVAGAKSRLDRARDRAQAGGVSQEAIDALAHAYEDAKAELARERMELSNVKPPKPPTNVRAS